jgi:uncharacterized protein YoxC
MKRSAKKYAPVCIMITIILASSASFISFLCVCVAFATHKKCGRALESLQKDNRVLKSELDGLKMDSSRALSDMQERVAAMAQKHTMALRRYDEAIDSTSRDISMLKKTINACLSSTQEVEKTMESINKSIKKLDNAVGSLHVETTVASGRIDKFTIHLNKERENLDRLNEQVTSISSALSALSSDGGTKGSI